MRLIIYPGCAVAW